MRKYCFALLILAAVGCSSPKEMTVEELNKYITEPEHSLVKSVEQNGYTINVIFRPTDLLVNQEIDGREGLIGEDKLKSIRRKYASHYYFMLELSRNNREALMPDGDPEQYGGLLQNLSFRMHDYVMLLTSKKDTIYVADFVMDRTYGLNNSTNILFAFSKESAKDKEWVQFNLKEFGLGTGDQRFRFGLKDLEQVPSVKFNITVNQ